MKVNRRNAYRKITLTLILLVGMVAIIHAQSGPPQPPGGPGGGGDVPDGPIDGFIGLAILTGAYFGGKKLMRGNRS